MPGSTAPFAMPSVSVASPARRTSTAARVMARRYKEAATDFSAPVLAEEASAALWRGYIAAQQGRDIDFHFFALKIGLIHLVAIDRAVAIMANHFHIVVQVPNDPSPKKILADFKDGAPLTCHPIQRVTVKEPAGATPGA